MRHKGPAQSAFLFGAVFVADFIENANEYVARSRRTQERQPSAATEADEVEVALSVNAFEALGHDERPHAHKPSMGHPQNNLGVTWRDGIMPGGMFPGESARRAWATRPSPEPGSVLENCVKKNSGIQHQ